MSQESTRVAELEAENKRLRLLICTHYAGPSAYFDDGEMQDNSAIPCIDFKRDSVDLIMQKMRQRGVAAPSPDAGETECPNCDGTRFCTRPECNADATPAQAALNAEYTRGRSDGWEARDLVCEGCGKTMSEHNRLAQCQPEAVVQGIEAVELTPEAVALWLRVNRLAISARRVERKFNLLEDIEP